MTDSILNSTKKILQIPEEYDVYDVDILMHINTTFFALNQLSVGPEAGFSIEGADETWEDYLGTDPNLNAVKTYVAMKVKLLFDPPATSFAISAIEKNLEQLEWRLNVYREGVKYPFTGHPLPTSFPVLDGGTP